MKKSFYRLCMLAAFSHMIFFFNYTYGQVPDLSHLTSQKAKTGAWLSYCESLRLNANKAPDNYAVLAKAALNGILLVPPGDATNRSRFFYFAAFGNYYQVKFDSARYYFYQSLYEAKKAGSTELMASACVALIPVNFQLQQSSGVDSCKDILQSILDTTHSQKILQDGYSALGSYYQQKSYYATAQDYLLKSIDLRKRTIDTTTDMKLRADYAIQCYLLSKQYQNLGVPDKSYAVLRQGLPFSSASPIVAIRYLSAFTEVNALIGRIDSALVYERLLEKETAGSSTVPSELVSANMNIAKYYLDNDNPAAAVPYITRADTLATKSKSPILLYQAEMIKGRYMQQTGNFNAAILLFNQSLPVARKISREQYAEELGYMSLAQKGAGNIDDAWAFNKQYISETDSLNKEKISQNFADLETRYQTRQKEQQISTLGKENQLQVLDLQSASRTRLFLVLGLVALGIIALLLYLIYRNKDLLYRMLNKKNDELNELNNQLLQANETKAKLFAIIGHDLRSPVSRIVQLMQLQKENPELLPASSRMQHEQKLRTATENVLETMEDLLLWSKSQMQHFSVQLRMLPVAALVQKEATLVMELAAEKGMHIVNEIAPDLVQLTDENFLTIILRNLLQNAIRHGDAGTSIAVKATQNKITISNTSSGIHSDQLNEGLKNKQVMSGTSGLGLQIAGDLAASINASLYFKNEADLLITCVLQFKS